MCPSSPTSEVQTDHIVLPATPSSTSPDQLGIEDPLMVFETNDVAAGSLPQGSSSQINFAVHTSENAQPFCDSGVH